MNLSQPQAEVLDTVATLLTRVVGDDAALLGPIRMETSFSSDLELESIEFVALAELLGERYGGQVDFVSWLSGKELDQIISLRVADLVDFIVACRS